MFGIKLYVQVQLQFGIVRAFDREIRTSVRKKVLDMIGLSVVQTN